MMTTVEVAWAMRSVECRGDDEEREREQSKDAQAHCDRGSDSKESEKLNRKIH
jgi:hypothetical protein